ncbi:phospholipase D-like protein [Humibacillus xanthopallidus]|uniref:Phospholipase D-like protein n=1 Tax=Humibacillus xanthopallidus TaxID=412689 RepID=A0A543PN80_9MICO|nr:phospholipase D-like domain-containing protein [Humibacillus xanthopallidus]TQN45536.1 phospholipase D-like protein [Humibacillus xanthopallidus]
MTDATQWFVPFAKPGQTTPADVAGLPWGSGTEYASRSSASAPVPMDTGCTVEPIIGGYWAMSGIRDSLVACLEAARKRSADPPPTKHGQRGLVYVAGWRCNPLRDLSSGNSWQTSPWMDGNHPIPSATSRDETVLGLLLACIAAGVTVRVMLWMPTSDVADRAHGPDHLFLAHCIAKGNELAKARLGTSLDLGVVCLDTRVSGGAGSHHQKMCVIRCADETPPVAYAGGVDLAWTRRDAPIAPGLHSPDEMPTSFYSGDWQSGESRGPRPDAAPQGTPWAFDGWPFGDDSTPAWMRDVLTVERPTPAARPPGDLDAEVYGEVRQKWHDQHLRLRGPVVATIEHQFRERWGDSGEYALLDPHALSGWSAWSGRAYFTAQSAITDDPARPGRKQAELPPPAPVGQVSGGTSAVQMWRTIPFRKRGPNPTRFARGEFTVMRGYARAMSKARNLICICDQYFWSLPAARLLNRQLRAVPTLGVVIVLPPHADAPDSRTIHLASATHVARRNAIAALVAGLDADAHDRVVVVNAWDFSPAVPDVDIGDRGVYVHAKAHVYDGELLVCGSANINRRSFLGDTELALAVHDPAVVSSHLRRLWSLLTAGQAWPQVGGAPYDASTMGGKPFVTALRTTALRTAAPSNVIVDPHFIDPTAETQPLRRGSRTTSLRWGEFGNVYNGLMENCSLPNERIESATSTLQDVSAVVEDPQWFAFTGRVAADPASRTPGGAP